MSGGEHWGGACTCAPLGRHVVGPRDVRSGFSGSAFTEAPAAAHRAPFDIPDFDVHLDVELGRHGRNRTNVWEYPGINAFGAARAHDLALHPTVKPVEMVADAMLDCSNRGDVVLDSFVGSGTTIVAAEKVGRRAYAMELDPLYVDTAIRRWQTFSGDRAIHAATGTAFDDLEAEGAGDVDAREVRHG